MPSLPRAATSESDNPLGGFSDFFSSSTFHAIVLLVLFFVGVPCLALVLWTFKDAKRRVDAPRLVAVSLVILIGAVAFSKRKQPEIGVEGSAPAKAVDAAH